MSLPVDYYRVLSVTRDVNDLELLQAYRRAALQSHPLKNADKDPKSITKEFSLIAEAFDVLRNPEYRAIFDQFGERGLKQGVKIEDGSQKFIELFIINNNKYHVTNTCYYRNYITNNYFIVYCYMIFCLGVTPAYSFQSKPEETFEAVFGTSSPFTAVLAFDDGAVNSSTPELSKPATQEIKLFLSLEEIYSGCIRTVKITRRFQSPDNSITLDDRALIVEIGRGWKNGTKIVFEGEGDKNEKGASGDVAFIIQEKPHPLYKRSLANNDLLITHKLKLVDALCGSILPLTTLDGRQLTIALSEVLSSESHHIVNGEGFPKPNGSGYGNLIIDFKIEFPEQLSLKQKQELKLILNQ